jgi:hypothetical protein
MSRRGSLLSIMSFVLLGACGDGGLAPVPSNQIRAWFPPGGVVDVIEVDTVNHLPLRSAELIAPDGQLTQASYLAVNPSPSTTSYLALPTSPYATTVTGVGTIDAGLTSTVSSGAPQQQVTLQTVVSTASLPLPDPVDYRREWRNYRIRLDFGIPPGDTDTRELAAPEPPAGRITTEEN